MIDPSDAACSPSTCLRAEAEDLMERATKATQAAEAYVALAGRYEAAAQILDQHADKTDAPFLGGD